MGLSLLRGWDVDVLDSGMMILSVLLIYNAALIAIGIWTSRRAGGGEGDFIIGGRALGGWVAGLSYAATSSSAWVLLGFSGFVYSVGLSALWMLPGVWGGYVAVWMLLGSRLRAEAAQRNYMTLTEFLAGDAGTAGKPLISWIASALILFCFIFYIAAQLQAAGGAMNAYFEFSIRHAIILSAAVIGIYSLLGGFWAVSTTDMIQGVMMAIIGVATPVAALIAAGGPAEVWSTLAAEAPGHLSPLGGKTGLVAIGAVFGAASIGLGTLGQPQLLVRVMAVKSDSERRKAFLIAITWSVIVFCAMAMLGLAGRALAFAPDNPEQLLFSVIDALFPTFFAGLALAALLSAIMSTVDSILLASAAAISHDIGVARLAPRRVLLASRIVMALLTIVAIWVALSAPATIFDRVLFAWTALGAAFGPIVVARVANWRPAAPAVVAAMIAGFGLAVGFNQFWPSGPGAVYERLLPWGPALAILFLFRRPPARAAFDV